MQGAKDFIIAIKPSALQSPKYRQKANNEGEAVDDDTTKDELEIDPNWALYGLESAPDDQDLNVSVEFEPGDVLGKALALIKQV